MAPQSANGSAKMECSHLIISRVTRRLCRTATRLIVIQESAEAEVVPRGVSVAVIFHRRIREDRFAGNLSWRYGTLFCQHSVVCRGDFRSCLREEWRFYRNAMGWIVDRISTARRAG